MIKETENGDQELKDKHGHTWSFLSFTVYRKLNSKIFLLSTADSHYFKYLRERKTSLKKVEVQNNHPSLTVTVNNN